MHVYVLTSNRYMRCLPPFAYLFNKFWGAQQAVTVVGYDERPPRLPSNFGFMQLGVQDQYTWAGGALRMLDLIPDEPFILMLEDYFLSADVNVPQVHGMARYMHANEGVVKIDLTDDRLKVLHTSWEPVQDHPMVVSHDEAPFQMSVQAAIWRPSFMRRFLNDKENAWMSEKNGTRRIIKARQEGKFNGVILGSEHPPVTYINAIGGEGNMPDVWALKRFPGWMRVDLEARGWL